MLGFSITDPSNSLEWMIFLAKKYSSMFLEGTWLTRYKSIPDEIRMDAARLVNIRLIDRI